jgi:hypothetical protein
MSQKNASFIPPDVTPPDPPEARTVARVFSVFMSVILLAFIGFVSVEFLADMAGHPLKFGIRQPPPDVLPSLEPGIGEESKILCELITPKHQTLMMGSEIAVIYTRRLPDRPAMPPDLVVDDARHSWETQYGDNTWFARLLLQAGPHRVHVEEAEADFFVETLESPVRSAEPWVWNLPHPDTNKIDQCHDCHEMIDQPTDPSVMDRRSAIGAWKGMGSCFACHPIERHDIFHAAIYPMPLNQCLRCHAMH